MYINTNYDCSMVSCAPIIDITDEGQGLGPVIDEVFYPQMGGSGMIYSMNFQVPPYYFDGLVCSWNIPTDDGCTWSFIPVRKDFDSAPDPCDCSETDHYEVETGSQSFTYCGSQTDVCNVQTSSTNIDQRFTLFAGWLIFLS